MGIFGKRGCDEERDYSINVWTVDDDEGGFLIAEQLTREEAEQMYSELKKEFKNNEPFLDVEYRGERFLLPKNNITVIKLVDD